ncbi:MAG: hypothetical protein HPY53_10355 [Brevinematales bacterium]|nr:hypothetical protein [Brevinematales bacterium]
MKKGFVLVAGLFMLLSCAPAVEEVVHGVLIAGSVKVGSSTYNAVYWDNGVMHALDSRDSFVYHSFRDGSDLYVLGYYYDSVGERHYGYWKNGAFFPLGFTFSSVKKIAVADGTVYVSGKLTNTSAGYWENGVYHNLYSSNHYYMQAIGIAVSGTNIAVVGNTNFLNSKGYWLNSAYHEVTNITGWYYPYFTGDVLKILCSTNNNELGYLENGVYTTLIATNFYPQSVDVYGTNVYISGYISDGSISKPYYLKNGVLISLNCSYSNGIVGKAIMYNNEIYFAGCFGNSTVNACYWKAGGTSIVLDTRESFAEVLNN